MRDKSRNKEASQVALFRQMMVAWHRIVLTEKDVSG